MQKWVCDDIVRLTAIYWDYFVSAMLLEEFMEEKKGNIIKNQLHNFVRLDICSEFEIGNRVQMNCCASLI